MLPSPAYSYQEVLEIAKSYLSISPWVPPTHWYPWMELACFPDAALLQPVYRSHSNRLGIQVHTPLCLSSFYVGLESELSGSGLYSKHLPSFADLSISLALVFTF